MKFNCKNCGTEDNVNVYTKRCGNCRWIESKVCRINSIKKKILKWKEILKREEILLKEYTPSELKGDAPK